MPLQGYLIFSLWKRWLPIDPTPSQLQCNRLHFWLLSFSPFVENYFRVISYTFPFVSEFVIELGKPGILKFEYKHFCIITIFWSSGLGVLIVRVGVYSGLLNLLRKHSGTLPSGDRCTWCDMVTLMTEGYRVHWAL